jgi:hypothetical protein
MDQPECHIEVGEPQTLDAAEVLPVPGCEGQVVTQADAGLQAVGEPDVLTLPAQGRRDLPATNGCVQAQRQGPPM